MPLKPGSRLGAYEILAAIGAGGMGEVFRARDSDETNNEINLLELSPSFSLRNPFCAMSTSAHAAETRSPDTRETMRRL